MVAHYCALKGGDVQMCLKFSSHHHYVQFHWSKEVKVEGKTHPTQVNMKSHNQEPEPTLQQQLIPAHADPIRYVICVLCRQEMLAAGAQRLALSSNSVVPYFHPENSPLFGVRVLFKIYKNSMFFRCTVFSFHRCRTDKESLMFFRP